MDDFNYYFNPDSWESTTAFKKKFTPQKPTKMFAPAKNTEKQGLPGKLKQVIAA